MIDILVKLVDLHKQATTEHSHYYVAKVASDAIAEIERLRAALELIAAGKEAQNIARDMIDWRI